jgi:adenine-specific DNA-methyltransferase
MQKLENKTLDLVSENINQLRELFPEAFKEGKIDFDALRRVLGDEVETENERYSFTWHGKSDAIKLTLRQSTGTLKPCKEESKDWDTTQNLFIEGDNLEVLRILQASYRNKIKMIYIDPPYNTGNDFIYEDDFKDPIKNYKEKVGEIGKANPETTGRYHTNWLNMMYPRLRLARNLLKDDGAIFISIDDHEVHNLRKICDEVFGEENFIGCIVRTTGQTTGQDSEGLGSSFDYLMVYSKSPDLTLLGLPLTPHDLKRFENEDERGKYAYDQMRKTGSNDKREDRPNMYYPIKDPDGKEVYPVGPTTGYESCWRFEEKTYKKLLEENIILWKKTKKDGEEVWWPYVKYYLEGRTKRPSPLWDDLEGNKKASRDLRSLFENKKLFDFPKPLELIIRIAQISCNFNDLILDFFSGSATTAHAVMALNADDGGNRRCISVQIPEKCDEKSEAFKAGYKNIAEISKERIRRAGEKIKSEKESNQGDLFNQQDESNDLDIGFKVFKLEETNFTQWDEEMSDKELSLLRSVQSLKPNCTQEDALYEILLKYGIDISLPIEEKEIRGKKVFSLAGNYLLICLEKDLGLDVIEEIAKLKATRVVFYDDGFKDDSVKLNAEQTLKKFGVEDIRVI